jgi:hypothetical protein
MNFLQVGLTAKEFPCEPGSLLITDEPIFDNGAKIYNPADHGLNTLPLSYRAAREFAAAVYPDKDLMTYRNGRRALTRLVMNADRLDHLRYGRSDDDKEAKGVVSDILLSPLLGKALRKPIPRWLHSGSPIVAVLNRKEIGDDDARFIANILISEFDGQVIIPDFGFYARPFHTALIRQDRLIAGVNTLSELDDKMKQRVLLFEKEGRGCTFEDARELAKYDCKHPPHTDGYDTFIKEAMAA